MANEMKLKDVGCPQLIPQGNLNPNQAGSFANIRAELDAKTKSNKGFQATTSYGFKPGYTINGLKDVCWGCMTF